MQHTRFLQNFLRPQNYLNHIQNLIYICIYSVHQSVALWRQRLSWHYEQQHLTFCTSVSGTVKTKTQLALWTAASHIPYISQRHCEDKDSVGIMNSSISRSVHQSVALWRQRLSWHYEQQHLTFCISVSGTVKTKTELALWTAASHVPLKGRKRNLSIHKEILFLENINKVMKVKGKSSNFSSHWQMLTGKSGSQPPSSRTCKEVQWPKLVL